MALNGTSNIYGVNLDGTPDTSGAPYATGVMCGGNFTANSSTTLASPADSTHTQSLGLQVNGTVIDSGPQLQPREGWSRDAQRRLRPGPPGCVDDGAQNGHEQLRDLFDLTADRLHEPRRHCWPP